MTKNIYKISDIVWVKLNGEEHIQSGMRPAIIIQNNKGNYYSPNIQIIPLTSKQTKSPLPTHVKIPAGTGGLLKDSIALCESVMLISKSNIVGYIGKLNDEYMAKIAQGVIINTPIMLYLSKVEINNIHNTVQF